VESEIVVIGAGGLGREVRDAVEAAALHGGPRFGGFLDDAANGSEVIGSLERIGSLPFARYIVAIGDCAVRADIVRRSPKHVHFASVIHPAAVVSPRADIGPGVFVAPMAYVGTNARVGSHSIVNVHAQVGHDAKTGEFATLSPQSTMNGNSSIGEGCFLGTAAVVLVGVNVGRWSKVSAGSCVTKSVGEGFLLKGNPATGRQMFRPRHSDD
jgi:sugar O-acyltransferase (sialic acid O-acetyltransferase NeuD family)